MFSMCDLRFILVVKFPYMWYWLPLKNMVLNICLFICIFIHVSCGMHMNPLKCTCVRVIIIQVMQHMSKELYCRFYKLLCTQSASISPDLEFVHLCKLCLLCCLYMAVKYRLYTVYTFPLWVHPTVMVL